MKIYMGGPMRHITDLNWPAFDEATTRWREAGYEVFNPAEMDRENGLSSEDEMDDAMIRFIFANDFHELCFCDGIALLPGWQKSKGAVCETIIALMLKGLKVYDAMTMEEIEITANIRFDINTLSGKDS